MNPGDTVRWIDRDKRSHFVVLEKLGRTRARIRGAGVPVDVPIDSLTPWPPARDGGDTTPPQRRAVRRGR